MKFIDLAIQQKQVLPSGITIREAINERISNVLNHGQYILGPEVNELEEELAQYVGVKYCVSTSSGTDALLIALMALGITNGDEIITTPFSFIATSETIVLLGAKPIYVDIDPKTYNIDPKKIEKAITSKTKAILPVSLYGQPAAFNKINEIAKKYNLPVIEDAAQSFGAKHFNKKSCSLTDIAATSFFPSKPFGAYGDAGACFTDNKNLADKMKRISLHGQTKRYEHTELGINGRMDTIQAAILLAKLPIFDQEVKEREKKGLLYTKKLNAAGFNNTPTIESGNTSVYAQYTIEIENRANIQEILKKKAIPTAIHYPSLLNDQPALSSNHGKVNSHFENSFANKACKRVLSLPMYPWLPEENQEIVVRELINAINSF